MICNKHNKKSGSTILLILTISMVVTLLCGTMLSAMLFTMKGNEIEKKNDDLLYAAEGGFELGRALVAKDIVYRNTVDTIANPTAQAYIDSQTTKLGSNTVHSVKVTTEQDATNSNQVKIVSTAYGKNADGTKNINDKSVVNKVIKLNNSGAGDIFKNSIVAEDKVEIDIPVGGGLDMGNTSIASGNQPDLPNLGEVINPGTLPSKNNNVFESAIFKSNIVNNSRVEVDYIERKLHGTNGLIDKAIELNTVVGGTSVPNGVGKFRIGLFNVILVNSDNLIIQSTPNIIDELKVIVICSGKITFELGNSTSKMTNCNIFGKNVTVRTPSSLHINEAPLLQSGPGDTTTGLLTEPQLIELNRILSLYIENWNSSTGGTGGPPEWNEVEDQTVYE